MAFNQKNPPWQRNAGHQNMSNMQAIVGFPQAQPVYNPNIGLQQQQNLSILPQMGMQQQQAIYSQTVQYPTNRPVNAIGFQNQPQSQPAQLPVSQNSSKFNPSQRNFSGTGMVTKVQVDFGFIDDEVFFHKNSCVKGVFPKVGDRVLVDAAYNSNMPFKWNASRVQVLNGSNTNSSSSSSVGHSHSSHARSHTSIYSKAHSGHTSESRSSNVRSNRYSSPTRKSLDRHRSSDRPKDDYDDSDRRRKRDDRDSDRSMYREKHRDRSSDRGRERERSPIRKPSPKRRRVRSVPRYMVQVPKHLLTIKQADVLELRRRYNNLYIPSDFFVSDIRWSEAFPPEAPFSIRSPCFFHVMHKDVEPPPPPALTATGANEAGLDAGGCDPPDADYLFSAKVMLMSTPPLTEFYANCIQKSAGEGGDRYESERNHMHPTRMISFLVGMRGKNETMAIGGPWSPSLDGTDPQSDPTVLIRTAVRTCRALTGIDLSNCSQWYRFVELYYRRSESYHKGRLIPPRVETVVIFLPDVRSCQPTRLEWEQLRLSYKASLARIINCSSSSSGGGGSGGSGGVGGSGGSGGSSSNGEEAAADTTTTPPAEAPAADDVTNSSSTTTTTTTNNTITTTTTTSAVAPPSSIAAASEQAESSTTASSAEPAPQETAGETISPSASNLAADDSAVAGEEKDSPPPAAAAASPATPSAKPPAAAKPSPAASVKPSPAAAAAAKPTPPAAAATKMDTGEVVPYAVPDLTQEYKKMKVADLKAELSKRNLPTDGLKATLVERLSEADVQQRQLLLVLNEAVKLGEEEILEPPVHMDEEGEPTQVDTNIKQEQLGEGGEEEAGSVEKVVEEKKVVEVKEEQDPAADETIKQETKLDVNTDVEMAEIAPKTENHEKDVAEALKEEETPSKPVKDECKEEKDVGPAANDATKQEKVVVEPAKVGETNPSKPVNHEIKQEKGAAEGVSEKSGSTTESGKPAVVARKKEEPVKLTEKDRQVLERRYQLPEKPHIIVHPSRMAKSGKFDCSIMSLSVLLDYRPEDTKEHSFEVALFSELFNEMLTRDFGFNIYRALCEMPLRKQEADDSKKEGAVDGKATTETSAATSNGEESSGKTSEKGDDSKKKSDDKEPRDRKRSRRSETPDGDRGTSRDKDSGVATVINSELLLSFVYFDVTHCGYIAEKDVEDLIYTLGLNLSRSQIRKTVGKATTREPWYYRKLTDKMVPSLPASTTTTSQPDETVSPAEKAADADKSVEMQTDNDAAPESAPEKKQPDEQPEADAPEPMVCGNTDYKQQLKASLEQLLKEHDGEGRLRQQQQHASTNSTSTKDASQLATTRTGIIEYNGCVVDVGKLLEQVKRTESAREEGEKQLVSLQAQYAELLSNHTRATSKIKDLQSETKSLSKQLADSVRVTRNASQTQAEYLSVINQVYDRVRPIAQRSARDGSSSAGSSKRESSKEKSSRVAASSSKSSKEKEKEKDKDSQPKDSAARKEDDTKGTKEKGGDSAAKNRTEDGVGGGDGGGDGGGGGSEVAASTGTTD